MPRPTTESLMNTGISTLHCGQRTRSVCDGETATTPSQRRHLKVTVGVMKPLLVMLLLAASVQAQSLVDAARKEKERQSKLQSTRVLVVDNSKSEVAKPKTE